MKIGWLSFHQEGLLALYILLRRSFPISCIITLEEDLLNKRSGAADYAPLSRRYGLPLHRIRNINDSQALKLLADQDLDLLLVIGWSQIVGEPALALVRHGAVGAHASLLPRMRGSAPINWAIINGERRTGNTLIWLAAGIDEGDIIDQQSFPIGPYDSCQTLYDRVAESNAEMLSKFLERFLAGERPRRLQGTAEEPALPRRRPEDGLIDWLQPAPRVYDFVRGLTRPYPGSFSYLGDQRFRIWKAALLPDALRTDRPSGETLGAIYSSDPACCGQAVACGGGTALVILEIESDDGETCLGRELSDLALGGKRWAKHA